MVVVLVTSRKILEASQRCKDMDTYANMKSTYADGVPNVEVLKPTNFTV